MSSIIDAFNDSFSENVAFLKFFIYGIPVFFCAKFFLDGNMAVFQPLCVITAILLLVLLTGGINNVRDNKREILTLNPLKFAFILFKFVIAMVPQILVFGWLGIFITNIKIPVDIPHIQLIYNIIVWTIIGSIVLTSFLSFAKKLEIKQAYNYKVIFESCIDVFIGLLFFFPQWVLVNVVLIGPIAYVFSVFSIPFKHWSFLLLCSFAVIMNLSITASGLSQLAYDLIKGKNSEYDDNYQIKSATELSLEEIEKFKKRKR